MDFWKNVIFSEESQFEIFTPPSIRKIWRKNKTIIEPKNVLPTLKHGGGNVMVWGCVAHNGAGNLAFIDNKINALAYIDVLRHVTSKENLEEKLQDVWNSIDTEITKKLSQCQDVLKQL
ncbi:transposable element Tc1 transposase [Trichonephila clavipes]|nr:transposable element Tc1 transposase [Trichonephila clavipes]